MCPIFVRLFVVGDLQPIFQFSTYTPACYSKHPPPLFTMRSVPVHYPLPPFKYFHITLPHLTPDRVQAWIAATRLSAVFERLLREWILRTSPPTPRLIDLLVSEYRPCSACGVTYEPAIATQSTGTSPSVFPNTAATMPSHTSSGLNVQGGDPLAHQHQQQQDPGTIVCDRCDATYHLECLRPPLQAVPRAEWFCPGCVSPGLVEPNGNNTSGGVSMRADPAITLSRPPPSGGFGCWSRYAQAAKPTAAGCCEGGNVSLGGGCGGIDSCVGSLEGEREPPLLCGSGSGGSLERGGGAFGMGGMGEWGYDAGVPKALDWTLSRQARECLAVRGHFFLFFCADGAWKG